MYKQIFLQEKPPCLIILTKSVKKFYTLVTLQQKNCGFVNQITNPQGMSFVVIQESNHRIAYTESGIAEGSSSFSSGLKSSVNGIPRLSSSKYSIVESNSSTGAIDEQPE